MEFKEGGTLFGRFLEGNLKLGRLLLIGRFKKKKRGRKKKGEFSFWETNLGLEGLSYKMGEQKNERREDFSLRKLEVRIGGEGGDSGKKVEKCTRAEEGDCSQGPARYASCYFLLLFWYFRLHSLEILWLFSGSCSR